MKSNNYSYLILDTIRVPDAKKVCAENEQEWLPLYLGTNWQHQIDLSPICIRVEPKSAIWQRWETDSEWATSGVVFTFSQQVTSDQAMASLQKNITVTSENGRLYLLRFYSPSTFAKIAQYGEQNEIDGILGLAHCAHLSPLVSNRYSLDSVESQNSHASNTLITTKLVKELLA